MGLQFHRGRRRERSEVPIVTKYFLFFWNFICELLGLAAASAGAYILISEGKVVRDVMDFMLDPSCYVCLGGSVAAFLAFFGCIGALREYTCFLKCFNWGMTLMLLLQLVFVALAFIFYYSPNVRDSLHLYPEGELKQAILKYRDAGEDNKGVSDMQNLIDGFQKGLGCCGVSNDENGFRDWNTNAYFNCSSSNPSSEKCSVPPSCCKLKAGETINLLCGGNVQEIQKGVIVDGDTSKIYTNGCLKALGDWINANSLVLGGALLGVLLPQIFLICLSRNMIDGINAQKKKWNRRVANPT